MSTVDERVVQLKLENEGFNSGIKDSSESLSAFERALQKMGINSTEGIENVEQEVKRLDFSSLANNINSAAQHFSVLKIAGVEAIQHITDKVVDFGTNLVKSLTIDQVTAGWSKYTEKTEAVQTIMSATQDSWKETADSVTEAAAFEEKFTTATDSEIESLVALGKGLSEGTTSVDDFKKATKDMQSYWDWMYDGEKVDYSKNSEDLQTDIEYLKQLYENSQYAGDQIDYVNEKVSKLNWFSDETSYSLTDMVSNVGKFTSVGVDLETATTAMQGIATWAAKSGVNASKAGSAMYNMSQALGAGKMLSIDWNSIVNLGMATTEFKQAAMDSAVAVGTLTQTADGLYKTSDGTEVTVANLKETLSDGWFTSDVMLDTLNKYGAFTTGLSDLYDSTGILTSDLVALVDANKETALSEEDLKDALRDANSGFDELTTEEQTKQIEALREGINELSTEDMEFGERAFKAAQEAKTFGDAIDATKDAASTAWMNIFEGLIGNYNDQKRIWTNFANFLYDTMVSPLEGIQDLIDRLNTAGLHDALFGSEDMDTNHIYSAFTYLNEALFGDGSIGSGTVGCITAVKEAFEDMFPGVTDQQLRKFVVNLKAFCVRLRLTDDQAKGITGTVRGILAPIKFAISFLGKIISTISPLFVSFRRLGLAILTVTGSLGNFVASLLGAADTSSFFEKLSDIVSTLCRWIDDAAEALTKFSTSGDEARGLIVLISSIKVLFATLKPSVASVAEKVWTVVKAFAQLAAAFAIIAASKIVTFLSNMKLGISNFVNNIGSYINYIKNLVLGILELAMQNPVIAKIVEYIGKGIAVIKNYLATFSDVNLGAIIGFAAALTVLISVIKVVKTAANISKAFGDLTEAFGNLSGAIKSFKAEKITTKILKIAVAIGILAGAVYLLGQLDAAALWRSVAAVAVLGVVLAGIALVFAKAVDADDSAKAAAMATVMLEISGSVALMVAAIYALDAIPMEHVGDILKKLGIVLGALAAIFVVYAVTTKGGMSTAKITANALSLLVLVRALANLVAVIEQISSAEIDTSVESLKKYATVFIAMAAVVAMVNKLGGSGILKVAASAVLLGIGIFTIGKAIKMISEEGSGINTDGVKDMITSLSGAIIALAAFSGLGKDMAGKAQAYKSVGKMILSIAASMLLIVAAVGMIVKLTAKYSASSVYFAMTTVESIMAALGIMVVAVELAAGYSKKLANGTELVSLASTMLAAAVSVGILVGVTALLAKYASTDTASLEIAIDVVFEMVLAIVGLVVGIGYASKLAGGNKLSTGSLILGVIAAVALMAVAIKLTSGMSEGQINAVAKIIFAAAIGIAAIGVALSLTKKTTKVIEKAAPSKKDTASVGQKLANLALIVGSIAAAVAGIYILSNYGGEAKRMIAAAATISGVILALAGVAVLLSHFKVDGIKGAATLAILAASLIPIAISMAILDKQMDKFDLQFLKKLVVLGVIAAALAALAIGFSAMGTLSAASIAGAASMLVMALSLVAIAESLNMLSQVDSGGLAKVLKVLVNAVKDLGLAVVILAVVGAAITLIGVGVALIGVGFLAAGAGALMFATALAELSVVGGEAIASVCYGLAEGLVYLSAVAKQNFGAILLLAIDLAALGLAAIIAGAGIAVVAIALGITAVVIAVAVIIFAAALLVAAVALAVVAVAVLILAAAFVVLEYVGIDTVSSMFIQFAYTLVQVATIVHDSASIMLGAGVTILAFGVMSVIGSALIFAASGLISGGMSLIGSAIDLILPKLSNLVIGWSYMQDVLNGGSSESSEALRSWASSLGSGSSDISDSAEATTLAITEGVDSINEAESGFSAADKKTTTDITSIGTDTAAALDSVKKSITESADGSSEGVMSSLGNWKDMIFGENGLGGITDMFSGFEGSLDLSSVFNFDSSTLDFSSITSQFEGLDLSSIGVDGGTDFLSGIGSSLNIEGMDSSGVTDSLETVKSKITSAVGTDAATEAGEEFDDTYATTIDDNQGEAFSAASDLGNGSTASLKVASSGTKTAGSNFVSGFVDKIREAVNDASASGPYQTAYELGQKAVEGLKAGINSASPSKETRKVGGYFTEGFIIGINSEAMSSAKAAEQIGLAAVDSLNSSIDSQDVSESMLGLGDYITSLLDSTMDYNPVITPVVDLTNVRESAGEISSLMSTKSAAYAVSDVNRGTSSTQAQTVNGNNVYITVSPKTLNQAETDYLIDQVNRVLGARV